jgi:phosphoribosylformimino-5-aminoimidazole carboxamide ribotide isomerase
MTPLLYPAIDLLDGKAVRLHQGERRSAKVFAADPAAQARAFTAEGAQVLHVVDLDAAFGGPRQLALISRIVQAAAPAQVQVGGGIRDLRAAEDTLEAGAARVILGTAAIEDPGFAGSAVDRFGAERVACGIDVKQGRAASRGWTESRGPAPAELASELASRGVRWLVVTAIARDGTLQGFDLPLLGEVARSAPRSRIIASGGAGELEHLKALAGAGLPGLAGAVAGTALYERKFTVREGQAALEAPC